MRFLGFPLPSLDTAFAELGLFRRDRSLRGGSVRGPAHFDPFGAGLGRGGGAVPMVTIVLAASVAVADYRALDPQPVAVEGGVLLVRIAAEGEPRPAETWPERIPVVLDDGREVAARIAWLSRLPDSPPRSWTTSGEVFTVVERPADPNAMPLMLLETPPGYDGDVRWNGEAISPRWLKPAPPRPREPDAAASRSPEALPDPAHPLEWFRWVLLAEQVGDQPPPPPGDAAGRLAARHLAEVWRAAIARIERASPGVAAELRQRLTATCTLVDAAGPEREIAAWLADPQALRTLLGIAIDPERDDASAMQGVLSWLRGEPRILLWPEEVRGEEVTIAVANPGVKEAVLRCRWLEGDSVPVAVVVPARTAQRVSLKRPVRDGVSSDGGVLIVEHGTHRRRLEIGARPEAVRPPGGAMGLFRRPLSLAFVQAARDGVPPESRRGAAELRRRQGRWELFVECFRPADVRRDELVVRIGSAESPAAVLRIPEVGPVSSGPAEVHRASHPDRWRCRIVLPDAWLAAGLVGTRAPGVGCSIERRLTLAGGEVERTAIGPPQPPWRERPATEVRDLSRWSRGPGDRGETDRDPETLRERRILRP